MLDIMGQRNNVLPLLMKDVIIENNVSSRKSSSSRSIIVVVLVLGLLIVFMMVRIAPITSFTSLRVYIQPRCSVWTNLPSLFLPM